MTRKIFPRQGTKIVTQDEADRVAPSGQRIVVPDKETQEEILERAHRGNRCGDCANFRLQQGQAMLADQRVFLELYKQLGHDPAWYGRTDVFGLCAAFDMTHMCATHTPAVVPAHLLDSSLSNQVQRDMVDGKTYAAAAKDEPRECPYYRKKNSAPGTDQGFHYLRKRRNYEG